MVDHNFAPYVTRNVYDNYSTSEEHSELIKFVFNMDKGDPILDPVNLINER
jgi:hypothetical protein